LTWKWLINITIIWVLVKYKCQVLHQCWITCVNLCIKLCNLILFVCNALEHLLRNVSSQKLGLAVVGSQIVGLVPLRAMLQTASYFSEKENLFLLEEDQKIRLVVDRLGLHSVGTFNPKERVIEWVICVSCRLDIEFLSE